MIRFSTYRQKDKIDSYRNKRLNDSHIQASIVNEIWFMFILIYRSRIRITDSL